MQRLAARRPSGTSSPKASELSGARTFLLSMIALVIVGCATTSQPVVQEVTATGESPAARQALAAGIRAYEDGQYAAAAKRLEAAIELGLTRPDEVTARKYLAFVHCVSRREMQCRYEFRLAIAIDPAFDLAPAEAGHPLWGPVFRELKGRR